MYIVQDTGLKVFRVSRFRFKVKSSGFRLFTALGSGFMVADLVLGFRARFSMEARG
jgi:hypothetical protein